MKKIFTFLILLAFVFSCGKVDNLETEQTSKQDFILEVKSFGYLGETYILQKSSKIEPSSDITLLSETSGRIENLSVKEGEEIQKGQKLAYFSDNSLALNNNYRQALLNLDQAKINYENNKLNLEKNITDAELNLQKLKNNLEVSKKTLEQDKIKLKNDLENSDITNESGKSYLNIQKIDNSIEKMEFEYEIQKKSNQDKIQAFITNLNETKENLNNLITNSINFGEELFSIGNGFSRNSFYHFLGAENIQKKSEAEESLRKLIDSQKEFSSLELKEEKNINEFMEKLNKNYIVLRDFLDNTLYTLNSSLVDVSTFPESQKNLYTNKANSYISSFSLNYSSFIGLKNSIINFLSTYKDREESLKKQIELARKDKEISVKNLASSELNSKTNYEKLLLNAESKIYDLELQIKTIEINLQNAKISKDITLRSLQNSIKTAELNLSKTSQDLGKLVVKSPISGKIADIFVTVGQFYNTGTKVLKIINNSKRELDVFVTAEDLEKIDIGNKVKIEYMGEKFEGEVFSKSNSANETLNYKIKVSLNKDINIIGGVANLTFELKSNFPLFPLKSVNILNSEENKKFGEINILENQKIEKKKVELGEVYGENIEIKTPLEKNTEIILNDISTYDSENFNLKIQK